MKPLDVGFEAYRADICSAAESMMRFDDLRPGCSSIANAGATVLYNITRFVSADKPKRKSVSKFRVKPMELTGDSAQLRRIYRSVDESLRGST